MNPPASDFIYGDDLQQRIRVNLKRFDWRTHTKPGWTAAAVAITIVALPQDPPNRTISLSPPYPGHAAIILTRRASRLRRHAGQWALPGGRMDPGESPEQTVLRELEEDVGLELGGDRVLGRLDDYSTRSGFTIKPIVVWGGAEVTLTANPEEVASIHRIPLAEFMRPDAPILEEIPESDNPVLLMPVGSQWIAAPTAAMLYQFREVAMLGNAERVGHYEQPYFAWR